MVELLRSGRVAEDFWDWREGQDFSFGRGRADAAVFTAQADAAELASPDDSNGELEVLPLLFLYVLRHAVSFLSFLVKALSPWL